MKILAINGSPRGERGSTAHMLAPLLEGMRNAGAYTEIIHLARLKIEPCSGCYFCWLRTPGKCRHNDDMSEIFEKYIQADLVVFGTPLYHYTMSGLLKNFIDRTLPAVEPWLIEDKNIPGLSAHPARFSKPEAIVLVSPGGFPELDHFKLLTDWFRFYSKKAGWKYLAEILRPGAEILSKEELQSYFTCYYDLLRQAGEELIRTGNISQNLDARIKEDLFPGGVEDFRKIANEHWSMIMKDAKKS